MMEDFTNMPEEVWLIVLRLLDTTASQPNNENAVAIGRLRVTNRTLHNLVTTNAHQLCHNLAIGDGRSCTRYRAQDR